MIIEIGFWSFNDYFFKIKILLFTGEVLGVHDKTHNQFLIKWSPTLFRSMKSSRCFLSSYPTTAPRTDAFCCCRSCAKDPETLSRSGSKSLLILWGHTDKHFTEEVILLENSLLEICINSILAIKYCWILINK